MTIPKTGLFIDKAPDREAPPVPVVEGAVPVEGEAPAVPEMIPGEWFYTLKASNGEIIAGNGGLNTSRGALGTIKSVRDFFKKNRTFKVYNIVTGEFESLKG